MPFPEVYSQLLDLSLAVSVSTAAAKLHPAVDRLIWEQEIRSPEAAFCLRVGLTTAVIVRPILDKPVGELVTEGFLKETGGQAHNPHRQIDRIGGAISNYYLFHTYSEVPVDIRTEEEGVWRRYPQNAQGEPYFRMVIDPLDGTSDIPRGRPFQAMGMVMTDHEGRFVASCVTGLRRPEVLVADGDGARLFRFDEKRMALVPQSLHLDCTPHKPVRVSVLKRRLEEDPEAYAFIDGQNAALTLDTFGGAGLLALVSREIDAMMDRQKGQIWYEAVPWGMTAQAVGCPVTAPDGSAIDFAGILAESLINPNYNGRQKIVICRNREVQAALLEKVRV